MGSDCLFKFVTRLTGILWICCMFWMLHSPAGHMNAQGKSILTKFLHCEENNYKDIMLIPMIGG